AFITPIAQPKVANGKVIIPEVAANPDQDEASLIFMDSRGNPIVTQSANGLLKFMTYDACKQPVRGYQWVSGYKNDNGKPVFVEDLHLHANRQEYDSRQNISLKEKYDDANENSLARTYREIDGFSNCTGEGPEKNNMLLK